MKITPQHVNLTDHRFAYTDLGHFMSINILSTLYLAREIMYLVASVRASVHPLGAELTNLIFGMTYSGVSMLISF